MEDWALIRRLAADGVPKSHIATQLGISRTTVYAAAESAEPPRYVRGPTRTSFAPYELRVRSLLEEYPTMPTTVIAERVGWQGSSSWFRQNIQRMRPEYAPEDPGDRLRHSPGDQIQCDLWFPPVKIPVSKTETAPPPVPVMVASCSHCTRALMIPTRRPMTMAGILGNSRRRDLALVSAVPSAFSASPRSRWVGGTPQPPARRGASLRIDIRAAGKGRLVVVYGRRRGSALYRQPVELPRGFER